MVWLVFFLGEEQVAAGVGVGGVIEFSNGSRGSEFLVILWIGGGNGYAGVLLWRQPGCFGGLGGRMPKLPNLAANGGFG